jgi:hypothetical protein
MRASRLADSYVGASPPPTTSWADVTEEGGICNVPASAFLRPYSRRLAKLRPLQERRLRMGLRDAARGSRIFHVWWHPHNFARNRRENFSLLETLLDEFANLAGSDGLKSMSMQDVAVQARERI